MPRLSWFLCLTLAGCGAPPPPDPPRAPPSAWPGRLERQMANCPSAQPTAVTRVEDVPGGVALLVTATGEEPTRAIRALAAFHQRIAAVEGKRFEHTGMHGGPGDRGWCPIVHTGTHVSFMRIPGGARIEVRVLPGHDVEALRREVNARIAKLPKAIANQ